MREHDLIVIGGGVAGLAAAIAAKEQGVRDILILEREEQLGGYLNQYIDADFSNNSLEDDLTGPEYAQVYIDKIKELNIKFKLNTLVIGLTRDRFVTVVSENGILELKAKAVILAMGSREKPRGGMNIPMSRAAGIFTTGTAQKFINQEGYMPGRHVLIIGSADIGLVMARRMALEGASVKAVVEAALSAAGNSSNLKSCLEDFNIPLKLGYIVMEINGKERIEGAVIARVDKDGVPISCTEEYIDCDTILVSVGLFPENELPLKAGLSLSDITGGVLVDENMKTSVEGIYACGDVVYIHDYKEDASEESCKAAINSAEYINKYFFEK